MKTRCKYCGAPFDTDDPNIAKSARENGFDSLACQVVHQQTEANRHAPPPEGKDHY
jgi:hypothetical protein